MTNETAEAWKNFRNTGLLWFVNRILHVWGIAIVLEMDENENVISAQPELVDAIGFSRESEVNGYLRLRGYAALVSEELLADITEEEESV